MSNEFKSISDNSSTVLLGSIAAYTAVRVNGWGSSMRDSGIQITLKSGDQMILDYKAWKLRRHAIEFLDSVFMPNDLESNPCAVCEKADSEICDADCGEMYNYKYFKEITHGEAG